jgi:hypothetical protein
MGLRIMTFSLQIVQMHIRFHHGQELGSNTKEYVHLIGDVLAKCDHIEWKV